MTISLVVLLVTGALRAARGRHDPVNGYGLVPQPEEASVPLHFWTTWCLDCAVELPVIQDLAEQYEEELQVIGDYPATTLIDADGMLVSIQAGAGTPDALGVGQ